MIGHTTRSLLVIKGDVAITNDPSNANSGEEPTKEKGFYAF
jgi:hypothetical protein